MSNHPEPGALRAALDGERPDVAAHLDACEACRTRSEEQARDARFAATALTAAPASTLDVDAALARVRPAQAPAAVTPLRRPARRSPWLAGRAAAAVVVLAVIGGFAATPGGRAYATSILDRFRAEQVAVVPVDVAALDPSILEGLVDVAEIEGLEAVVEPQEVADLAEAAAVSGIQAAPLDPAAVPGEVTGPTRILAQAPQTVRVDFADDAGLPAEVAASTLVLQVPGAVVQAVEGAGEVPAAVRGEAGTLEVAVEGGATLDQVRDAVLSQPGLPPQTVASLRAIDDWETTLPLPVPVGYVTWEETTVNGRPAVAFGDESGLGSALLWNDGERWIGVGGVLPLSEVRRIAESG